MIGTARALYTIVALLGLSLPLIPVQIVLNRLDHPMKRRLPVFWHRCAARLIGLRITVEGDMTEERPLLIAANHVSWLDIVALGASAPLSFIAKQEVSGWPAFGLLAKLQRTVFVNRERRSATGDKTDEIAARLRSGDVMVLFAEGTSSCGSYVLPFRSALFGAPQKAAELERPVFIQPVALAYTHLSGMVTGLNERPFTGFYGDTDLAPHLFAVLKHAAIDVTVRFADPVPIAADGDRKAHARHLEDTVRAMKTEAFCRRGVF